MEPAQIAAALDAVVAGTSIRAVAKQYYVFKDYLRRRIQGKRTRSEANEIRQSLSFSQEQLLVD